MKKNKIILLAAIIIGGATLLAVSLGNIDYTSANFSKTLKSSVYDNYETLKTEFYSASKTSDVVDYLYDWAHEHSLSATRIGNSLEITKAASEAYIDAPKTTIQVDINLGDTKDMAQNTSVALSTIIGAQEYGEVTLLFTPVTGYDHYGTEDLQSKNLDSDYLISLKNYHNSGLTVSTSSVTTSTVNGNISMVEPSFEIAYEISVSGLELSNNNYEYTQYDNPILEITDYMSSLKNQGIYFEFANLEGGRNGKNFPSDAKVTLVFDERNSETFQKRIPTIEDYFDDKYKEDFSDYKFEIKEVTVPTQVIAEEDADRILAFFYTLPDYEKGLFEYSDNEKVIARTMVNTVSTTSSFESTLYTFALNESGKTDNLSDLAKVAALSDFSIASTDINPYWSINPSESELNTELSKVLTSAGASTVVESTLFLPSSNANFANTNPQLEQIIFNVNNTESFEQTMALIDFLKGLTV